MTMHSPLTTEMIMQTERELALARFEHMRRHGLLAAEPVGGGGIRSWIAGRLAGLALRLDRPAAQGALNV